ncbi:MAG: uncharacterized protein QOE65_3063 [Solirubrobacteraceae bacterium]|jgi:ketosteroid isomerase-like protein|nr:uncharacterized protein [Solirubrobacteraceae bacterium]
MSPQNVEIVRSIYEAVARRDVRTPFRHYADDIAWDPSRAATAGLGLKTVYHGHEGVRDHWREGLSVFREINLDVRDLVDAGDQVLAVVREHHLGRASGAPVEAMHYAVWTLAGGKATRMRIFDDRDEAEAAAGLAGDGA